MRPPLKTGEGKHDRKVIAFVNAHWASKLGPPTIREISTACGIPSTSVTLHTLHRLAKDGIVVNARGFAPTWVKLAIERHNPSTSRQEAPGRTENE